MTLHEPTVPVEHRLGRDEEALPALTGDELREQGDECSVEPGEARTLDLASEHCQLLAQDHYLDLLGQLVGTVGAQHAEETGHHAVAKA